jgi:hypothetical protein
MNPADGVGGAVRSQMSLQSGRSAINAAESPITALDWVLHTDIAIQHPLSRVWPAFRDIRAWYWEYHFEVVAGAPYLAGDGLVEGQVIKVTPRTSFPRASKSDGDGSAEYFLQKTIRVVPNREIVVLLSGGPAYDFSRYTQFYVWKVMENGEKSTTLSIDCYGEAALRQPLREDEYVEHQDRLAKNFYQSWAQALEQLKKTLDVEK